MTDASLRRDAATLLLKAARSRVDASEAQALARAARHVRSGQTPDKCRLPHFRFGKGLVMALGWAAEALEATGQWREEALSEYRTFRDWHGKALR